jgi:ABC-type nitrate/sulfonate/bicarbonate transport system permease component
MNGNIYQRSEEQSNKLYKILLKISWFHILGIASVILVFIIWTILSEFRFIKPIFLPSPSDVYIRFLQVKRDLAYDFFRTFYRMVIGYVVGCSSGLLIALLMGRSRILNALATPIIQILKPIPPLALTPFAILWWGTSFNVVFFLVTFGCFFVMVLDGIEAIKNVPKIYHWAGAALGENEGGIYRRIVLPSIIPSVIGGLRVSIVMAFNLATLAEFNIASGGLGDIVIRGYRHLRTDILFLGIFCVVALALVVDLAIVLISRKLIRWTG